jgi:cyclomaltodextrinase
MSGPEWVADAVFYQIFPDRFARSSAVPKLGRLEPWDSPPTLHGYKGGDLHGVIENLDHLGELGVNAIYLTPIVQSASNHRYHAWDYFRVDPMLGGDRALDALIEACHARGMRIVLDAVLNHVGRGHFAFHDLLENGASSPFVDWFHVEDFPLNAYGPGAPRYKAWWGIPALPKLRTENPEVRAMLLEVIAHWAGRGIDGWRFDTPEEIATPGFWEDVRSVAKRFGEDFYLVGEIWHDASSWLGSRFDGTMGYWLGGASLVYAAQDRFRFDHTRQDYPLVREPLDAASYGDHVERVMKAYGDRAGGNLNLVGSHDTARVRTLCGDDAGSVALAWLLLFTVPGAPCIYYGDEIGMRGEMDPGCRAGFPIDRGAWDHDTLHTVRELIALRRDHVALRRGSWRRLARDERVHAFAMEHADERAWIATNATSEPAELTISEPLAGAVRVYGEGELREIEGRTVLRVPPRRGVVFATNER